MGYLALDAVLLLLEEMVEAGRHLQRSPPEPRVW